MPALQGIHVEGLPEMQRAFRKLAKDLSKQLRSTLKEAAEPVRAEAETRASRDISQIGDRWSRMRTGVTTHLVYVAPRSRGRNPNPALRRPNMASLLMDRAMAPALKAHSAQIERDIGHMLDGLFQQWEKY
jgi:hypothetical protein